MSFRTSSHLTVLFCLIFISSVVFGQEEQARKWVDKTGKHELQAKFLDLDGDTVLLEMEGGKRMKIKLDQLSFDDQKYAITARTKMVASGDSSPFKSVGDSPMPTTPEKTSSGDEAKVINVRWTNARVMNPLLAPEEWSLEPDPAPATEAIESNAIPLPVKRDFFEGLSGTTADAGAGLVCVAHTLDHGGQKNTRVEVVDLKAGKVVRQAILDNLWAPLAVSDEGNTVVMRSNTFGFGGKERLAIWQMNADRTATPLRGWICGQPQARGGSAKDINWGAMVEGNRLVTLTGDGRLTIWDSEAGEPKAYMDMGSNAHATVSPGGKYILCGVGSALVVIEPARLRLVASLNIPEAEDQSAKVSVSPDGTRFAFGFGSNTHVYDFASARRLHEVVGISTFGDLAWADENHLLVGTGSSRSLINLEAGFLVWTYSGMS
ncbi:MAG: hypothetical protein KDA80_18850, partial [Planctomycetaceae bacterium]|nr:hypothetical protein [Planctomycetaceae bacterium]